MNLTSYDNEYMTNMASVATAIWTIVIHSSFSLVLSLFLFWLIWFKHYPQKNMQIKYNCLFIGDQTVKSSS